MADNTHDMGLHAIGIDGAAHGLAVDGQGTVGSAVVFVPLPQGGVELVRAHPDQHVADDCPARRDVPALVEARPEIRQNRLALVLDPLRDLLVAAHAGKCRGGGEREHRWQAVPPPLPAPWILHLLEVIGQGTHLRGGECHLRNSLVQAGIKVGLHRLYSSLSYTHRSCWHGRWSLSGSNEREFLLNSSRYSARATDDMVLRCSDHTRQVVSS